MVKKLVYNITMEKKLENKKWYRFLKIFYGFIIISAVITPIFTEGSMLDSVFNLVIWSIILFIINKTILYGVYGPNDEKEIKIEVEDNQTNYLLLVLFTLVMVLVIVLL
jgi:hypothetical protein